MQYQLVLCKRDLQLILVFKTKKQQKKRIFYVYRQQNEFSIQFSSEEKRKYYLLYDVLREFSMILHWFSME